MAKEPRPTIVGYPLCAVGESWRALAPVTGPARTRHTACENCSLSKQCSPPTEWNARELQPFGPRSPEALWDRFHARFCRALGVQPNELADRIVQEHAAVLASLPGGVWELEPSLIVTGRVEPRLRLVVFHGPLPAEHDDALALTRRLIASLATLHDVARTEMPARLCAVLERHAPFEMPIGFELDGEIAKLKAYARCRNLSSDQRRALCRELVMEFAGPADANLALLEASHPGVWGDVHMMGFATIGGRLVELKLYVDRDARRGWPELGLSSVPPDHPFQILSQHRSYAVIDLAHPKPRAHKWDYYLRERLLTGPILAEFARRVFASRAAEEFAAIVEHSDFHVDAVAGALRGETWAFYCALN